MKKLSHLFLVIFLLSLILPNFVSAQIYLYTPDKGIPGLINLIGSWLKLLFPIIISFAIVWFAWFAYKYAIFDTDAEKTNAKHQMTWGLIAIFVMVSVWGFVAILQNTFGTTKGGNSIKIQDVVTPVTDYDY